jgi:hypothetical protein
MARVLNRDQGPISKATIGRISSRTIIALASTGNLVLLMKATTRVVMVMAKGTMPSFVTVVHTGKISITLAALVDITTVFKTGEGL